MKIMVVGSSGYIGRHVVKTWRPQGADVVAFDVVPAPAQLDPCPACHSSRATWRISKKSWRLLSTTASNASSPSATS